MLINCTTKGCLQQSEAKLDRDTNEVVCDTCGTTIQGISEPMKKALSSMGQVLRNKKALPFQQYCTNCRANKSLCVKGSTAHCETCSTQVHVTPAFMQGLKLHLERQLKYENDGLE